jgi:bifunctional non-homologous end joining protein LigD
LQLHKRENEVRFYTRRGHDWTKRFSSLIQSAWYLPVTHLILDGEVIVPTASGHSDFGSLEDDLGTGRSDRFVYFVFDILHINGISLRDCALVHRKSVLLELLRAQSGSIRLSDHLRGGGESLFKRACHLQLEGSVSKRKDSKYRSGRAADWTKRTCRQRETFVVAGIAFNRGKFDGVYLARREDGELIYAGKVENGFDASVENRLRKRVGKLKTNTQPLTRKSKSRRPPGSNRSCLSMSNPRAHRNRKIASPFVQGHPRGSLNRYARWLPAQAVWNAARYPAFGLQA